MTRPVEPQEIRAQLARLRAAEPFATSPQLVAFLDYAVEEALAGRAAAIKGYTVAVEALGRPPDFDPQGDPIVRVEARRLRQALASYYQAAGRSDPVVIDMPTGGYAPVFRRVSPPPPPAEKPVTPRIPPPTSSSRSRPRLIWRAALAVAATMLLVGGGAWAVRDQRDRAAIRERVAAGHGADLADVRLPVIRVAPFEAHGDNPPTDIAQRLTGRFTMALTRFDEIRVLGPVAPVSSHPDGDYLLRGRILQRADGGYSLAVALLAPVSREALVAREYTAFTPEESARANPAATPEAEALRSIAIEIAQPFGVVAADQLARLAAESSDESQCLHAMQMYGREITAERHARTRACLTGAYGGSLPTQVVQANLAFLDLDEHRLGLPGPDGAPLDRALIHARAAVDAMPSSARAHQALMDALFMRGQTEEAIRAGERAAHLNPFDMDILADLGARLVMMGRAAEGREKLLDAAAELPNRAPWFDFFLTLSALLTEDRAAAIAHADVITTDADPLGLIARLIGAKERGAPDQVATFARKLAALDQGWAADPRAMLSRRAFAPPVLESIAAEIEGALRAARAW